MSTVRHSIQDCAGDVWVHVAVAQVQLLQRRRRVLDYRSEEQPEIRCVKEVDRSVLGQVQNPEWRHGFLDEEDHILYFIGVEVDPHQSQLLQRLRTEGGETVCQLAEWLRLQLHVVFRVFGQIQIFYLRLALLDQLSLFQALLHSLNYLLAVQVLNLAPLRADGLQRV